MPIFEKLFNEVKDSIPRTAAASLNEFAGEAGQAMTEYLENAKADLRTCTLLLAAGKIGEEEFKSAVMEKLQSGKIRLIEIRGIKETEVDEFMDSIQKTFVEGAVRAFLISLPHVGSAS